MSDYMNHWLPNKSTQPIPTTPIAPSKYANVTRRPMPRSRKETTIENAAILKLLKQGYANSEIYNILSAEGHFVNSEGVLMAKNTACTLCTRMRVKYDLHPWISKSSLVNEAVKACVKLTRMQKLVGLTGSKFTDLLMKNGYRYTDLLQAEELEKAERSKNSPRVK